MADRFYSEGSKNNGSAGSSFDTASSRKNNVNPYSTMAKNGLGDFSENIDSNTVRPGQGSAHPQERFQVHINDFDDFIGIPEQPADSGVPKHISSTNAPKAGTPRSTSQAKRVPVQQGGAKGTRPAPQGKKIAVDGVKSSKVQKLTSRVTSPQKKAASVPKSTQNKKRGTDAKAVLPKQEKAPKRQLTPEQTQRVKQKRRYNFTKALLAACVCIFFIAIMTVTATTIATETINDILVIDKSDNVSGNVTIEEGDEFIDVFRKLEEGGFVKQKLLCYVFLMYRDYQTCSYSPGIYYLESNDGLEYNIETMMVRRTGSKDTVRLTFPEGWTIAKVFEKIEKYGVCTAEKLYANLDSTAKEYGFMSDIEMTSSRYLLAEGYLFPDTYDFYIEENPTSVLKKLFSNFESKWTSEYTARLKELNMSMDEIITIASIIQREAKNSSQMGVISSVIHNRLKKSSTFPTLDMNSTKDYITSLKSYNLFTDFYYELYLSTYNTYSAQGLPPGPICNPGIAAIKAALYPDDTDYYFFMHSSTGEIYLARTAEEHQVNTELYL